MNQIPVYYYPIRQHPEKWPGDLAMWQMSREADFRYVDEVERRMDESMNSREIGELVDELIRNYGLERAMTVLARTVQFRERDTQISLYVRIHAAKLPPDHNLGEDGIDPCVCHHLPPHALDALYRKMAEKYEEHTQQAQPEDAEIEDETEQEL